MTLQIKHEVEKIDNESVDGGKTSVLVTRILDELALIMHWFGDICLPYWFVLKGGVGFEDMGLLSRHVVQQGAQQGVLCCVSFSCMVFCKECFL